MRKAAQIILCLLITHVACRENVETPPKDVFRPNLIALFVEDIDRSIKWYREVLNFEVEKAVEEYPDYGLKIAFLESDGFHLEIIEKNHAVKPSAITLSDDTYIGGIFKIGFKTQNIENLYTNLKEIEDLEFVTGIGELPENQLPIPWPSKYFILKDPDGNFIQIFDSGNSTQISPWLTMITVENIESSISWYSQSLGFKHHQTLGEKGNQRAILERNHYVLELFEPKQVIKANQISADTTILGFKKIAFAIQDLSALDQEKMEIISPIKKSDTEWAKKAMIVKDLDGNWTQLFEINKDDEHNKSAHD